MSVVIIGGNERMERQYAEICRGYGCEARVFTKEARRTGIRIAHAHSASASALHALMQEHTC